MKYWIFDGDETQGPYDLDELKRLEGFNPESLLCPTTAIGENPWRPAKELAEMHPVFLKPPPPPGKPKPPGPPPPPRPPQGALPKDPAPQQGAPRQVRACPHCGGKAPGGSSYCNHCGGRLDGKAAAPKKKRSSINGPALFVLAAGLAALAWTLYPALKAQFSSPEQAQPPSEQTPRAQEDPWLGKEEEAVDLAANFRLKAPLFAKCPPGVEELSAIGPSPLAKIESWKEVRTLGDQVRCRPLAELAFQAVLLAQTKNIKPEDAARQVINGIQEIGGPEKFYSSSWTATRLAGATFRVSVGVEDEINNAAQETYFPELGGLRDEFRPLGVTEGSDVNPASLRAYVVDLGAKTVRPANLSGWRELDPKAAAEWSKKELEAHPGGKVAKGEGDKVDLSAIAPAYGTGAAAAPALRPRNPKRNPKKRD